LSGRILLHLSDALNARCYQWKCPLLLRPRQLHLSDALNTRCYILKHPLEYIHAELHLFDALQNRCYVPMSARQMVPKLHLSDALKTHCYLVPRSCWTFGYEVASARCTLALLRRSLAPDKPLPSQGCIFSMHSRLVAPEK